MHVFSLGYYLLYHISCDEDEGKPNYLITKTHSTYCQPPDFSRVFDVY